MLNIEKLKILYSVPYYPTGKHHGFIDEIAELERIGYEVIIAPIWESYQEKKVDSLNVKIIYNPNLRKINRYFLCILICFQNPYRALSYIKKTKEFLGIHESFISLHLLNTIRVSNPNHIHAYFANNAALKVLLIAQFLKISFTCSGRGTDVLIKRIPHFNFLVNNSNPFFTISYYNKKVIDNVEGVNSQNVKVIHHGIQVDKYPKRDWQKINNDVPVVTSVTWLRKVKGVEFLIEACNILKNKGVKYKCQIVGDGYLRNKIEMMIDQYELKKNVQLLGQVNHPKVINILLESDIFVLPSLSEGIAISVMEAMAIGLPVVVTDITGMRELVDDNKNGFVVPPSDEYELSYKIEILLKSKYDRVKFGDNAIQKVQKEFNIKLNINNFLREVGV